MKCNMSSLLALVVSLVVGGQVAAADVEWPTKPVRIVVPFSSGTGLDVMARGFAEQLHAQTGGNFIVENRDGAGGGLGSVAVARLAPDGYTLLFTAHSPFASAPFVKDGPTYDPVADFTPISKVAQTPMILIAGKSAPFSKFDEFVRYAHAHPAQLNYASSGIGTPSHLHMEVLKQALKMDVVAVPYKNTGQAMTDLIGGQVSSYMPSYPAALPQLRAGQVKALAIGSARRYAEFPNVPTIAEVVKRPDMRAVVWYGFLGPKGMSPQVVSRINTQVSKAASSAAVQKMMSNLGAEPDVVGPDAFRSQVARDADDSRKLLRALGVARDQ